MFARSQERKVKVRHYSPRTETRYIRLDTGRCQACWECVQACPKLVFGKVDLWFHRHAILDRSEECTGCLRCLKACPNQAILRKERPHDSLPG